MIFNIKGKGITKTLITFFLIVVIVASVFLTVFAAEPTRTGIINTQRDYVHLRATPSTSASILVSIPPQTRVTVRGEERADDGWVWYITEYNGNVGYVRSDLVNIIPEETTGETTSPEATTGPEETTGSETTGSETDSPETTVPGETSDETTVGDETTGIPEETTGEETQPEEPPTIDFEAYMDEQKFPDSYKPYLRELHNLYPNWVFKAQHVEWDFEYAVDKEHGVSLVENNNPSSWKSIEGDAYDWNSSTWKIFDGDRWVRASRDIIRHYMDPRNSLGVNSVFQFLDQSYDSTVQNIDGVKRIIAGTFMENDVTDTDGNTLNYATAIYNAGVAHKVNPYVLSSMIIIEVGSQGSSIVSGTYPGYEGYFNFFNIGAYTANGMNPIQRGLWYAKGGNNNASSYGRPWNTRLKAINGGAEFYADGYLTRGQNTLYLKRFNIQGDNPFTHRYMTSVYGASVEATKLAKGYTEELRTTPLSFYIPVYKRMPEEACPKPTLDGSPNMKLTALSVSGYELTPDFDTETLEYMLVVPPTVGSVNIVATAMDGTATVEGAGDRTVNTGNNVFEIKVTAGNGTVRVYKITVAKESLEGFGELTFTNNYVPRNNIVYGITPGMTVGQFRTLFVSAGLVTVRGSSGNEKADGDVIATDDTIVVCSTLGVKYAEYKASVWGDLNCDGKVTISDLLKVRNKILGADTFTEILMFSGDIDGGGSVNISDLLKIRNHILGTSLIQ